MVLVIDGVAQFALACRAYKYLAELFENDKNCAARALRPPYAVLCWPSPQPRRWLPSASGYHPVWSRVEICPCYFVSEAQFDCSKPRFTVQEGSYETNTKLSAVD